MAQKQRRRVTFVAADDQVVHVNGTTISGADYDATELSKAGIRVIHYWFDTKLYDVEYSNAPNRTLTEAEFEAEYGSDIAPVPSAVEATEAARQQRAEVSTLAIEDRRGPDPEEVAAREAFMVAGKKAEAEQQKRMAAEKVGYEAHMKRQAAERAEEAVRIAEENKLYAAS